MNRAPQPVKHYASARRRFLQPTIQSFLQTQCPKVFGPLLAQRLAEKLGELIERQLPPKNHLRPGQLVWNAVSIQSRPDSPRLQLIPVILTLISPSDIDLLTKGTPMSRDRSKGRRPHHARGVPARSPADDARHRLV